MNVAQRDDTARVRCRAIQFRCAEDDGPGVLLIDRFVECLRSSKVREMTGHTDGIGGLLPDSGIAIRLVGFFDHPATGVDETGLA